MNQAISPSLSKCSVLGVNITPTSYAAVVDKCTEWINQRHLSKCIGNAKYICVTSVHGVMMAQRDTKLRSIINCANIATPDGMPIVWALRSFGIKGQQRVYGPNLMLALCSRAVEAGYRIFLYGSRPETLHQLEQNLRIKYPLLNIVGSCPDPFHTPTSEEDSAIQKMILESNCQLFVCRYRRAEAKSLDGRSSGCLPRTSNAGRWRGVRFSRRPSQASAGVDSKLRTGMAFPPAQ